MGTLLKLESILQSSPLLVHREQEAGKVSVESHFNCRIVTKKVRGVVKDKIGDLDLPAGSTRFSSASTNRQAGLFIFLGAGSALCGAECGRRILACRHLVINDKTD